MKQVVQNYKSGELALLDVPVPACKPGGVLVRTAFSLISTGTEMMKVSEASLSLLGKAKARPDQVAKVMQSVATNGVAATYRKVTSKLDSYTPLGYSLCGVVEEVGEGVDDVAVGDLVACAGNEHALHSELNWVPRNLYCRVPDGVAPRHAAFGTVGSIALQGVRRGEPQLGDVALVIGLGLIGQLVVQLLVASGVRVLGVDPDPDRCALAERLGALVCGDPGSGVVDTAVGELTAGHGVDQVYLAAGGGSNEPVELAARLSRDRGRVIDIGKCSLNLPWNAYYEKELDVRFSRSYGPGRYDPEYELEGRDYPIGYVRWTERRNLECFVDLLGRGRVDVEPLVSHIADFTDAVETYRRLGEGELKAVAVLFRYPDAATEPPAAVAAATVRGVAARTSPVSGRVRLGFVGAGNYASSMLLPHLAERDDVELRHVVTTSALSGANAQRKFGFAQASTDTEALLADPAIDAVFVVTRHSSHAALTRRALLAGKAVFVEKPLALSESELDTVLAAIEESGNDRLQVGFNRRFAPLLRQAKGRFGRRIGPASVRYLVNAGRLDDGSWYNRSGTEGTRFEGEGGHFVDTVSWLLAADPVSVYASSTPGQSDLQVLLRYADGSTAAISYVTSGSAQFPKETLDLVADGKVLRFDDFQRASLYARRKHTSPRVPTGRDKGQAAELDAFVTAVRTGGPMPVPVTSLAATTLATLAVRTSLGTGAPVRLEVKSPAAAGTLR
ncbi:bi-domain-containing oxidoreductase [Prauserella muralis]|uniref:Oxidoreductase n=1 Tax=Prauserella muralis TaxID=588067 RepID=A0A2V4BA03_9PSEU|nr:bi-domain-containing oxidoreductase [Prauserella muralis]PXY32090.1 oxidoreductase [Prauserella muralis]TWE13447.1 putative dehydrogenase [Prauserella muralis]